MSIPSSLRMRPPTAEGELGAAEVEGESPVEEGGAGRTPGGGRGQPPSTPCPRRSCSALPLADDGPLASLLGSGYERRSGQVAMAAQVLRL